MTIVCLKVLEQFNGCEFYNSSFADAVVELDVTVVVDDEVVADVVAVLLSSTSTLSAFGDVNVGKIGQRPSGFL